MNNRKYHDRVRYMQAVKNHQACIELFGNTTIPSRGDRHLLSKQLHRHPGRLARGRCRIPADIRLQELRREAAMLPAISARYGSSSFRTAQP